MTGAARIIVDMDETTNPTGTVGTNPTDVLTPPPPDPPRPPRPPRPRIVRRTDEALIAGVAAGIADHFDVDPLLVRIGFVVLALTFGIAIPLYFLAWWLMPAADGPAAASAARERARRTIHQWPRWLGIALLASGLLFLLTHVWRVPYGLWFLPPYVIWGFVLILVGVLVYRHAAERDAASPDSLNAGSPPVAAAGVQGLPATAVDAPVGSSAGSWTEVLAEPLAPTEPFPSTGEPGEPLPPWPQAPPPAAAPSPPPRPRRTRRERSPLGWLTFGAALLAIGVAALLDQAGTLHLSVAQYAAIPLVVVGLGLMVGSLWGRARGMIVLGILLVPPLLVASVIQVPLSGGVGQRFYRPAAVSEIPPAYHLAAGELTIDLRGVTFDAADRTVVATVAAGTIDVMVDPGVLIVLHASVGAGEITVLPSAPFDQPNRTVNGLKVRVDRSYGPAGSPVRLILDLRAGFGQITVDRIPAA